MSKTFCAYYDAHHCRSCEWLEQDYSKQIESKEQILLKALAFFENLKLEKSILSAQTAFRNRAKLSVTGTLEKPIVGLLGESQLDAGRELLSCPIHHPALNELIQLLPTFIQKAGLIPYSIAKRKGELKGIIAFYAPHSEQIYLRFVLRSTKAIPQLLKWCPILQSENPNLTCLSANIQPIPHAILEGNEEIPLTDSKTIDHPICGLPLKLAPQSFVQTNAQVAEQLYQTCADWIGQSGSGRILELFCGQGTFSFVAANKASNFLGIEINAAAIKMATENATRLGLSHIEFQCSDANQLSTNIKTYKPDLVLANPPRRGLAQSLQLILEAQPKHFIYSSCAVESLASDLQQLVPAYQINKIQLFDMFPHTHHFETLVWLVRKPL